MKRTGSLYARIIRDFVFLLLAVVLAGLICIVTADWIAQKTVIPDVDKLLDQSNYYETEQYQRIRIGNALGKEGYFEVTDQYGNVLYSSDPKTDNHYDTADFEYIPDVDDDAVFSIEKTLTGNGTNEYLIRKWQEPDDDSGQVTEIGLTVLNGRGKVVYSNMDADGKKISRHTVNLLMSNAGDGASMFLQKMQFETENGDTRYLLIHTESIETAETRSYQRAKTAAILIFLPVVLLAIVVAAFQIMKRVRQPLEQLNTAMDQLGEGAHQKLEADQVPVEFSRVFDAFNQMEVRLEQSEQSRQNLLHQQQQVMADISHDLKTPVTVVTGYVSAIRDGLISPEHQPEIWNIILEKMNRINELLNQEAEYSRLNHPDYHLNAARKNLTAFLKDYAASLQKELDHAGYPLSVSLPDAEVPVVFDSLQLTRVLENVVSNALKYTPKGTRITLQMESRKEQAEIRIGDNGPGIPKEIRGHVFDPFVIADSSRTSGSGTGLGLSIARRIIEDHHGTMNLLDAPGTVYEIVLPIDHAQSETCMQDQNTAD